MITSSYNIKKLNNKLDSLIETLNGAKGSGNFGHAGRPGKVGGSGPGNGMSTKSDSILHDAVKQMADIFTTMNKREGYKYSSSEDLVLKQGKFFTPGKRPEDIELGSKKECFANASKLALERSDLTYVEGYAMINDRLPLPIAHAWCVDKKGRVVDNTWENPGVSYFGVPFKTSYLAKKLSETGVYGILSGSVGTSDFLKDGVPSEGIANIKKQKNAIVVNGGKGSGNFGHAGRPGKVGGSSTGNGVYKKMVSSANLTEEEKRYKKYWEDYGGEYIVLAGSNPLDEGYEDEKYEDEKLEDGRTFEQARDYFDSMIRKRKFPEDTTVYRRLQFPTKSDLEKAIKDNFVWDAPQATSSTLNPKFLKDSKINPFKLVEDENCLILKINVKKGQSGLALDNSMEEIILPRYSEFKIKKEDKKIGGITTYVVDYVEHTTKENLNSLSFQVNGGPNSGKCLGFTTEEPLVKKVNQLIRKINEITGKGGNPYHDEKGRFASGPSSSSKGGSKSSIIEKGGMEGGYIIDTLDEFDDDQLSKLAKNPIANLSEKRLKEVASMREKMYGTKEEFNRANQWLLSIVGNGADIMQKAKDLDFDPSKEIKLSRKIIGDKEVTLFRNQEGEFDKKNYKESRWGDIPHSHSSSGNDYTIKGNKNNILIHPEVLYSADTDDSYYRNEREYVIDNSKIKDVWRGVKL